jgi:hypothetical protein
MAFVKEFEETEKVFRIPSSMTIEVRDLTTEMNHPLQIKCTASTFTSGTEK